MDNDTVFKLKSTKTSDKVILTNEPIRRHKFIYIIFIIVCKTLPYVLEVV